jgi:cytoskeletal protein RodZ
VKAAAAAPSTSPIPGPTTPNRWWIVPAVLVGLVVILWLFLTGMPFGRKDKAPERPKVETIAEAPTSSGEPSESATIVEVSSDELKDVPTSTTTEPVIVPKDSPPAARAAEPQRGTTRVPAQQPIPRAQPPSRREVPAEISATDAEAILRNYVTSSNYYSLGGECVRINNRGYKNAGYTLEVWDACRPGGASRMLGSWRVDSKTREVFRRRDDGRYLKP